MKVEIIERSQEKVENCDWKSAIQIKIDGEVVFSISDGEPEDANLGRDFADVSKIPHLLTKAYQAGKAGDSLEMFHSESSEI